MNETLTATDPLYTDCEHPWQFQYVDKLLGMTNLELFDELAWYESGNFRNDKAYELLTRKLTTLGFL